MIIKKTALQLMVHRLWKTTKNYQKGLTAPFVIYADFQAITEKWLSTK